MADYPSTDEHDNNIFCKIGSGKIKLENHINKFFLFSKN